MIFDKKDVDRSDFFQIHTYIQYFQMLGKTVKAGGLLYPISKTEIDEKQLEKHHATNLFGFKSSQTPFIVDGICFGDENKATTSLEEYKKFFSEQVASFLSRMKKYIK